eukprot:1447905-Rhodomonas_salina.1
MPLLRQLGCWLVHCRPTGFMDGAKDLDRTDDGTALWSSAEFTAELRDFIEQDVPKYQTRDLYLTRRDAQDARLTQRHAVAFRCAHYARSAGLTSTMGGQILPEPAAVHPNQVSRGVGSRADAVRELDATESCQCLHTRIS